jgi:hypothetical protein
MTGRLGRLVSWAFKYGYLIAYVSATLIAISAAFLTYYYIHLHR